MANSFVCTDHSTTKWDCRLCLAQLVAARPALIYSLAVDDPREAKLWGLTPEEMAEGVVEAFRDGLPCVDIYVFAGRLRKGPKGGLVQ